MTDLSPETQAFLAGLQSELVTTLREKFEGKDSNDSAVREDIRQVAMRKLWDYGREFAGCIPKVSIIKDNVGELSIMLEVKFKNDSE